MSFVEVTTNIEEIIEEARNGRMFILVDDEDRETEGDLVIPAQMATPEAINFMAKHGRGLVCLDGVSLTVNEVAGERFGVNIIPITQRQTNFGALWPGDRVNLEIDLVARYLARLLQRDTA